MRRYGTLASIQLIAHYEILEKLGEGGMGVVYKARDTRLNRFVALKVLPADKLGDEERIRRLTQEGRTASALNHPNIITIHDIGTDNNRFVTTMTKPLFQGLAVSPDNRSLLYTQLDHAGTEILLVENFH